VSIAYNQWTQFEEFPHFMEGVEEVRQLDDTRLYWVASIGGKRKEWYAKITEQVPDKLIAWESEAGADNGGVVTFEPIDSNRTLVTLELIYNPEDIVENVGDKLGFVSRRVQGDLDSFKEYIDSRGVETGAWRGTIHGGQETGHSGYMPNSM
jgi:uncharacterized membrane protein